MMFILSFLFLVEKHCCVQNIRLIGGHNTVLDYAYIVRLEVQTLEGEIVTSLKVGPKLVWNSHACTGTTITPMWTLTAAHCVMTLKSIPAHLYKAVIRYGAVLSESSNSSFSDVTNFVEHPGYQSQNFIDKFFRFKNDIGLLKTRPIHLEHYGKISAVDYSTFVGLEVDVVGYGLMSSHTRTPRGLSSTLILKKPLQVAKAMVKKCDKKELSYLYPILCLAGPCKKAISLCPGDSGGPLIHMSKVVAVNSMAHLTDCYVDARFRTNNVGYMTPLSVYLDWILRHVNDTSPDI